MWKHPKYYKELRKRNKLDQAISKPEPTGHARVRPDPGLNLLAGSSDPVHGQQPPLESGATSFKHQASSHKPQANQNLVQVLKQQATSIKPRAASIKLQATSSKLSDPCTTVQEY